MNVSPGTFPVRSPVDGSGLDSVEETPADHLPAIVATLREAQAVWSERSVEERARFVGDLKNRILGRCSEIARLIHREVGKPEVEAILGEILPTADVIDYWTTTASDALRPEEVSVDPVAYPKKEGKTYREPRGVVGLIAPYNFPFALPLRTIIPALLAGNAVLFKPSEIAARTGALLFEIVRDALPDRVIALVQGGGAVGAALCSSDVDLVGFTGSVATGRKVAGQCAERLIPCSIELGGKDAAIVLADADLERAANGIVWGAMMNAGQNCAKVERVYVERAIAEDFVARVVTKATELKSGRDTGSVATSLQVRIVRDQVDAAVKSGARILIGGESAEHTFAPTILRVESDDIGIMRDETFGPVLPIAIVENADDAIARANGSRFGLTASLWTRNTDRAEKLARKLRAGVVTINNHAFTGALPAAPWSGVGETGYGITNSIRALDALTRPRFVLVDRNRSKRELWWFPYTDALRTIAESMATLRNASAGIGPRISALGAFVRAIALRLRHRDS